MRWAIWRRMNVLVRRMSKQCDRLLILRMIEFMQGHFWYEGVQSVSCFRDGFRDLAWWKFVDFFFQIGKLHKYELKYRIQSPTLALPLTETAIPVFISIKWVVLQKIPEVLIIANMNTNTVSSKEWKRPKWLIYIFCTSRDHASFPVHEVKSTIWYGENVFD